MFEAFDVQAVPSYFVVQGDPIKVEFKSFENEEGRIDRAFKVATLFKNW